MHVNVMSGKQRLGQLCYMIGPMLAQLLSASDIDMKCNGFTAGCERQITCIGVCCWGF